MLRTMTIQGNSAPSSLGELTSEWALPDSEIAGAATRLVFDVSPAYLANHCMRSYLFARELAATKTLRSGVDFDDELLYLSCILHDLGAIDYGNGDQRFEVDGADAAASFLREGGVAEDRVTTVWQAIALHTTVGIAHRFGPEQAIAQLGISTDIAGTERQSLSASLVERVNNVWPRHNLGYAFAEAIAAQVEANPLKAPPLTFPAHVHHLYYAGAIPPFTFFDLVDAGGWGDQPVAKDSV